MKIKKGNKIMKIGNKADIVNHKGITITQGNIKLIDKKANMVFVVTTIKGIEVSNSWVETEAIRVVKYFKKMGR